MYDSQRTSGASVSPWKLAETEPTKPGLPVERTDWPATTVDVVVIGAGITGLSTAYHLLEAGRSVLVLDKGDVASGETARTTAHVSNALDDHYYELERMHGHAGARLAAESHAAAIASIESIAAKEGIACDFARVEGFLFAAKASQENELEREYDAAKRAGLDVALVDRAPLPFEAGRALRFAQQAQFEPLAYVHGLARAIREKGGFIQTGVRVLRVEETKPARIHVDGGAVITASSVVVATNTPIVDTFAIHTKQAAYRSYAIGVAVPKGSIERALYWDTEDPYHYVRLAQDDSLLIVGGADHKAGQSKDPEQSWAKLEQWTRERFPMAGETRYRWSGQVWEPVDGMAFIGRNPGRADHIYISTGDSGNGITHGALAGILITDLIMGRPNRWATLYDPSRKVTNVSAAREYVKENLNVAVQYGGFVKPGDDVANIAPGSGGIVRRGVHRIAV